MSKLKYRRGVSQKATRELLEGNGCPCQVQGWLSGSTFFFNFHGHYLKMQKIQLTWKLFLRLAVLYIFLLKLKRGWNYYFYFRTVHPRGGSHLPLRCWHTQQLRGFDESRNDQGIIQNRRTKINTAVAWLYLPESSFTFRILRLAQKNGANKNRVFLPFGWRWR
jgi:hypothetical protein